MVCFRDFCNHLVSDAWYRSGDDDDTVAVQKVKEAAMLIRSQIREMEYSNDEHPNASDLYLEKCKADVPSLLHIFINSLVPNDSKTVSIAQALIQASRPRTCVMPLMLYLAVQLDHMYGSAQLLQHLSRLGFCSSVDEVTQYKQSVMHQRSVSLGKAGSGDCAPIFAQFVANNVDHNVRTAMTHCTEWELFLHVSIMVILLQSIQNYLG